jgi:hypothetical protein
VQTDCCNVKTSKIKDGSKIEFTDDKAKECYKSVKVQLENCDTSKIGELCCGSDSAKKKQNNAK